MLYYFQKNIATIDAKHNLVVVVVEEAIRRIHLVCSLPSIELPPIHRDLVAFQSFTRLQQSVNLSVWWCTGASPLFSKLKRNI